ncbi:MAG: hypothetical protein NDI77_14750 [Geobacteraceae bacterium]|nr:hypothetical protein [Geobacteraceae bacterium]
MLTRTKYDQLLAQLSEAAVWLSEKAQIKTAGTRFDLVYSNVQEIVKRYNAGKIEALIEEKGNEELWLSLTECDAFIRIHSVLKNVESAKLPRQTLKDVVGGPLLPRDETPNSAQSRNKLFELELAARFHEAGIHITGFDDIQLYLDGYHIGVQCKRPYSQKNVRENLRSAKNQIRKRHSVIKQGMIAFAIDKLYETDRNILVVNTQSEIPLHANRHTNHFIENHREEWRNILNTSIIAVLVCMKYIYHIKDINLLATGFETVIYDRGISSHDSALLRQIQSKFAQIYGSRIVRP